jgi:hypothetical protein
VIGCTSPVTDAAGSDDRPVPDRRAREDDDTRAEVHVIFGDDREARPLLSPLRRRAGAKVANDHVAMPIWTPFPIEISSGRSVSMIASAPIDVPRPIVTPR